MKSRPNPSRPALLAGVAAISLLLLGLHGAVAGLVAQPRTSWQCPDDREIVARSDGSVACAKDLIPALPTE